MRSNDKLMHSSNALASSGRREFVERFFFCNNFSIHQAQSSRSKANEIIVRVPNAHINTTRKNVDGDNAKAKNKNPIIHLGDRPKSQASVHRHSVGVFLIYLIEFGTKNVFVVSFCCRTLPLVRF